MGMEVGGLKLAALNNLESIGQKISTKPISESEDQISVKNTNGFKNDVEQQKKGIELNPYRLNPANIQFASALDRNDTGLA